MRRKKITLPSGYAIFRPTLFQGIMPACYDGNDQPVVFPAKREAQHEIADHQLIRIREFLTDERDYNDAITTDEFVLPVNVLPDGSISIKEGRIFGKAQ